MGKLHPHLAGAANGFLCAGRRNAQGASTSVLHSAELLPTGKALVSRASYGAKLLGQTAVPAGENSLTGHALLCSEPLILKDLAHENRFQVPPAWRAHGMTSGAIMSSPGCDRPFGV